MGLERRDFLRTAGLASVAGLIPGLISCENSAGEEEPSASSPLESYAPSTTQAEDRSWENLRQQFELNPEYIHMAGLLLASHPTPVRNAISDHRQNLNQNPVDYVQDNFSDLPDRVRQRASDYLDVRPDEIALTDSTTMGTALVINGLQIREDQEMLTAEWDYYSTHKAIEFKSRRTGAASRQFSLFRDIRSVTQDEVVDNVINAIRPNTRLLTGTWVHSSTGLKLPVRQIADRLEEINASRSPEDRVIFFVDGVHGLGVENESISELGCDFFSGGTHKWMFAPRGTGILWGKSSVQDQVSPTIPTFTNGAGWGGSMTPGGFKAFEHQWAMAEAFQFHNDIGKERVQERIHSFAQQLKQGLEGMKHVTLYTPMEVDLSSGIVCFDVDGMSHNTVVSRLKDMNIIASDTPYNRSFARLTPGIYNTSEEIENVLRAMRELS